MLTLVAALSFVAQNAAPPVPPAANRPALATVVAEPVALFFAAADRDHDARTTRDELARTLADIAPAEPIGYIAFADWTARWLGDRNAVPTPFEIDRDGDNRVTRAELDDRFAAIFARLDADKDGVLTRAELLTVRATPFGTPESGRRGRGGDRARRR